MNPVSQRTVDKNLIGWQRLIQDWEFKEKSELLNTSECPAWLLLAAAAVACPKLI